MEIGFCGALTGGVPPLLGHSPAGGTPCSGTGGTDRREESASGWVVPLAGLEEAATGGTGCRRDSPEMGDADVGWRWCRIPTCPTAPMVEEAAGRWRDSG